MNNPVAGFTLTEMLVALAIVGLTSGGLAAAFDTTSHLRKSTTLTENRVDRLRRLQAVLDRLADGAGPFAATGVTSQGFVGTATEANFPCSKEMSCGVKIDGGIVNSSLNGANLATASWAGQIEIRYESAATGALLPTWPPSNPDRLAGLAIIDHEGPIAFTSFISEQPRRCFLDVVTHDCVPTHE